MGLETEYQIALELASTNRFREARERLENILRLQPDKVEALILLGKVEFYLNSLCSSRSRFEAALTYEPGNMAAYFGLEYFKERAKRIGFIVLISSDLLPAVSLNTLP